MESFTDPFGITHRACGINGRLESIIVLFPGKQTQLTHKRPATSVEIKRYRCGFRPGPGLSTTNLHFSRAGRPSRAKNFQFLFYIPRIQNRRELARGKDRRTLARRCGDFEWRQSKRSNSKAREQTTRREFAFGKHIMFADYFTSNLCLYILYIIAYITFDSIYIAIRKQKIFRTFWFSLWLKIMYYTYNICMYDLIIFEGQAASTH